MSNLQNPTEKKLTPKQIKAIPVILSASSISEGCLKAGISRDTFYVWWQIPAFKDEFTRQRTEAIDEALHILKASLTEAVSTLQGLLKAQGLPGEGTRLKAAIAIVESALRSIEIENLEVRISELERSLRR